MMDKQPQKVGVCVNENCRSKRKGRTVKLYPPYDLCGPCYFDKNIRVEFRKRFQGEAEQEFKRFQQKLYDEPLKQHDPPLREVEAIDIVVSTLAVLDEKARETALHCAARILRTPEPPKKRGRKPNAK
jgi:hypothetical protein